MCNLYSITKGPQAIRDFARAMRDTTGNLPPIPGVFPDYSAPIVRNAEDGERELTMARWGMPSPVFALKGRNSDSGVTNVRMSPRHIGGDGSASRADGSSRSRASPKTNFNRTARGLRSGSRSTKAAR
jgi:hypothetical protein